MIGKRHPYTASYTVPFVMRWPGHIKKGSVEKRFALNVDIVPTVLHAVGIDPVARRRIDGRSLLGKYWRRPKILVEQGPERNKPYYASTVTRRYQYIEHYDEDGETVIFREYYNLKKDPWQLRNLFGDSDPDNDPSIPPLADRLAKDRQCKGAACP